MLLKMKGRPKEDRSADNLERKSQPCKTSLKHVSYKWYDMNCKKEGGYYSYSTSMKPTLIGYARCSTDKQDLSAQKQALLELGVSENLIYTDYGLTGTTRKRPGLDQAIAAVREGDTLVVPKLDRLARSVPDARAIAEQLEAKGVKLALGGSVYDPGDPMGKMFLGLS